MHTLIEGVLIGKWRSFKTFKPSGDIRLNTGQRFVEFNFTGNRQLTIKTYDVSMIEIITQTDQWAIEFKNKKHYLRINNPKLVYEVITVNHTVMVLGENISQEKSFFAKEAYWPEHLKTSRNMLM